PSSFLLFYPSRAILPPHSFPTRRSSDLFPRKGLRSPAAVSDAFEPGDPASPYVAEPRVLRGPRSARRAYRIVARSTTSCTSAPTDRKSTRLNSSHVSISYAVFCLKKKKH